MAARGILCPGQVIVLLPLYSGIFEDSGAFTADVRIEFYGRRFRSEPPTSERGPQVITLSPDTSYGDSFRTSQVSLVP
jgi:hypothetical protein